MSLVEAKDGLGRSWVRFVRANRARSRVSFKAFCAVCVERLVGRRVACDVRLYLVTEGLDHQL